jgi:3-phenylpropionate/trans-cinnamate dioxygenase ferredoxin reductase subunit
MGFIGCEVAASLRRLGVEVTAILPQPVPLARVLGVEVGSAVARLHRERGVRLLPEDSVESVTAEGGGWLVRTAGGRALACDLVVAGVGIAPDVALLAAAGATVDDGVVVDERCRTSLPGVYAAGDIANHDHPLFGRLRVEHWNNAFNQGRAAALAMLDRGRPYDYVHSFWSDQFDQTLEYVGFARSWDRLVFRGSAGAGPFLAFYLRGGVLRAAFGLGRGGDPEEDRPGELRECARLIREGAAVDPARLADESCDLTALGTGRPG